MGVHGSTARALQAWAQGVAPRSRWLAAATDGTVLACAYWLPDSSRNNPLPSQVKPSASGRAGVWEANAPPATCVNVGLHHLAQDVDLVIAGPNIGHNVGRWAPCAHVFGSGGGGGGARAVASCSHAILRKAEGQWQAVSAAQRMHQHRLPRAFLRCARASRQARLSAGARCHTETSEPKLATLISLSSGCLVLQEQAAVL